MHPALFTAAHQVALRLKGALTVELNEVSGATDTSMLRESMLGSRHQPKRAGRALALLFGLLLTLVSACKDRPPKVPGESDIRVAEVTIESAAPQSDLALEHGALFDRLGERPGSLINPDRMWSPFREAEDRRRIEAFWQQYGYFDVEVANAVTTFDSEDGPARVTFKVRENGRYKVASVHLQAAPPEEQTTLEAMIPFKKGDSDIDLERFRKTRIDMAELLRRRAFGHANVYSRFYVDKTAKTIDVYLFVDAGPKTTIGSVRVDGAVKIPEADVVRRSGLSVGEPYTEDLRDRVVRDLMDSGAYSAAYVRVDTDTKFIAPGTAPDTGGELRDEQVDEQGNLIPRSLPSAVNLTVHVVEAPSQTIRLRAAFEIDPSRADTSLTATLWLRNLLGPMHHLLLEGRVGYGWLFNENADDRSGLFGEGLIRTIHPGVFGRLGDLRATIRYQGSLYPSAYLHRATTGPGVRTTFLKGLFLDIDLLAFVEKTEGFGPFLAEELDRFALAADDLAVGPEIDSSFVWDGRDDPIEPMRGGLIVIGSRINPLAAEGAANHPFVNVGTDLRGFIPLTRSISIALRGSGEWSLLDEGDGIPLGERLFGGGNYGFRGFGARLLSPVVFRCLQDFCKDVQVGGRSLVESSLELRFLPPLKQFGVIAFGDLGGASEDLNPFAHGPSVAAGLGARLRIWYLPAAVDLAYRILHEGDVQGIEERPIQVFFRIGEAF